MDNFYIGAIVLILLFCGYVYINYDHFTAAYKCFNEPIKEKRKPAPAADAAITAPIQQ